MLNSRHRALRRVMGPSGEILTAADLPSDSNGRWVISRKAQVVAAIRGGLISLSAACAKYGLTEEEITSWQNQFDRHGVKGLRATSVQQYRKPASSPVSSIAPNAKQRAQSEARAPS